MLAGRVKLKSFLVIASVLLLGSGAGIGLVWRGAVAERAQVRAQTELREAQQAAREVEQAEQAATVAAAAAQAAADSPAAVAATPAAAADVPTGPSNTRPHDQEVLAYVGRDIGTDKLKDVSRGKPWKINVYQDSGKPTANRAKVDLDRDDKWDEKWTFDPEGVQVQIDPADAERYSEVRYWDGTSWNER